MIDVVVDTSVWIDLIRGSDSVGVDALRHLEARHARIGITDVVYGELRAGSVDAALEHQLVAFRDAEAIARLESLDDIERAAACMRATADAGRRVRSLTDCLIASVCIREDVPILHRDRDFDVLASCTDLRVLTP